MTTALTVNEHRADIERIARAKLNAALDRAEDRSYAGKRMAHVVENLRHWWDGLAQQGAA